ncbi:MAG: type III pantothenate kinase [Oscillospiraceae bacterium]|nr:type III pantothenate kinase [Oscillospiraceae bacterium]MBR1845489.1 type III pantothenate kinase [Oscillospiraceae bacterium]
MILAIDVGNTNTVLGCIENGKILNIVRIQTRLGETGAEYAIKLKQLLEFYEIDTAGFEGAILSSVVPPVNSAIIGAVKHITGLDCMVVGPGMKTGMDVRIDDPGTLAGDLVVGSVAAIGCYGTPAIVLDMGTATTMVVIDKDGCYRGGAILPGVKLSYAALASGTSLLPDISITPPPRAIATNTVDSMRSGAVFGTAATVDGMIDRMEAELGYSCRIVATGGLAQAVTPYCKREIICDNDLLLKGLEILYRKNQPRKK